MYAGGDGYMLDGTLVAPAVAVSTSLSVAGEDVGQALRQMREHMEAQESQIDALMAVVGRLQVNVSANQQIIAEQAETIASLQASALNLTSNAAEGAASDLHARLESLESLTGSSALVANVTAHALAAGLHAAALAQLSGLAGSSLLAQTVLKLNATVGDAQAQGQASSIADLQQRLLDVEMLVGTSPLSTAVRAHNGTLLAMSGLTGSSALVSSLNAALNLTGSSLLAATANGLSSGAASLSAAVLALQAANASLAARMLDAESLSGDSPLVAAVARLGSMVDRLSSCSAGNASANVGCLCICNADANSSSTCNATAPTTDTSVSTRGNFTTGTINKGGISADSLYSPIQVTVDACNNVYVADHFNHRVLYYPAGSTTATRVYGQGGNFTSGTVNNGGVSADSLNRPTGITVDAGNNVYVTDWGNNRVLFYPSGSTTATRVYGQGGSFTTATANKGDRSADSLFSPIRVAVDADDNVYIVDRDNNRVLFYPAGSTTAMRVYGQGGSFTTGAINNGGIDAGSLHQPRGLTLDASNNLYVADRDNHRVLYYPSNSTTATRVYGQGGNFTTGTVTNGGISADSLCYPFGVTVDASSNVYIADSDNNRVLFYPSGSTTATRVYGQAGSFTTRTANKGGISANSLYLPRGVTVDASNNVNVPDHGNHRALYYPSGSTTATRVYGQP